MQCSARAVIVRNGFTPIVPGIREPSIAYKFLYVIEISKVFNFRMKAF